MATYQLITGPVIEPVSLAEAKIQCEIHNSEAHYDSLLNALISTAREYCEAQTYRAFMAQEWKLWFDSLYPQNIEITKCPVRSITSIVYINTDRDEVILDPEKYEVDVVGEPARIKIIDRPSVMPDRLNALSVTFTSGYTVVPEAIKQAIKLLIGHWFAHREDVTMVQMNSIPLGVNALLDQFKLSWVYPEE